MDMTKIWTTLIVSCVLGSYKVEGGVIPQYNDDTGDYHYPGQRDYPGSDYDYPDLDFPDYIKDKMDKYEIRSYMGMCPQLDLSFCFLTDMQLGCPWEDREPSYFSSDRDGGLCRGCMQCKTSGKGDEDKDDNPDKPNGVGPGNVDRGLAQDVGSGLENETSVHGVSTEHVGHVDGSGEGSSKGVEHASDSDQDTSQSQEGSNEEAGDIDDVIVGDSSETASSGQNDSEVTETRENDQVSEADSEVTETSENDRAREADSEVTETSENDQVSEADSEVTETSNNHQAREDQVVQSEQANKGDSDTIDVDESVQEGSTNEASEDEPTSENEQSSEDRQALEGEQASQNENPSETGEGSKTDEPMESEQTSPKSINDLGALNFPAFPVAGARWVAEVPSDLVVAPFGSSDNNDQTGVERGTEPQCPSLDCMEVERMLPCDMHERVRRMMTVPVGSGSIECPACRQCRS